VHEAYLRLVDQRQTDLRGGCRRDAPDPGRSCAAPPCR
jgi:hypothetical protein